MVFDKTFIKAITMSGIFDENIMYDISKMLACTACVANWNKGKQFVEKYIQQKF